MQRKLFTITSFLQLTLVLISVNRNHPILVLHEIVRKMCSGRKKTITYKSYACCAKK